MPANLTPQYHKAQERYRAATDPTEQLAALQEMLRVIPKHKGTEHLQADIKRRIRDAKDAQRAARHKRHGPSYCVDSGGYPQVVVIGPPNSGKSSLIAALTDTELETAPYPYTTHEPRPAMMPYENARIQLVDTPPIAVEHMESWVTTLARTADALLLVVDLDADDLLEAARGVLDRIAAHKLYLVAIPPRHQDSAGAVARPAVIAANKIDAPDAADALEIFREGWCERFAIHPVSATARTGLEDLRRAIWEMLDLVRAIPRPPHGEPDHDAPILLPRGSSVVDMATAIHRELGEGLRRARIWNCADHADGAWVARDHVIADLEIFELDA